MVTMETEPSGFELSTLEQEVLDGEPAAFGQFIRMVDPDLRAMVWSIVRSPSDVDDVMQTSYEKAFKSLETFEGRSQLKSWLYSICYRTALTHIRHESYRHHDELGDHHHPPASGPSTSDQALSTIEVESLFGALDADHRVVVMMVYGLGFTVDDASELLDVKRGTVSSRLARAREKLQKKGLV